jgi:ATP-dependent RNA helicase DDX21
MEDGNELSNFVNNETTIAQLVARGITKLFPIQKACYEFVKKGDDLIGKDRTGSGKTLTYSLPLTEQFRE